MFLPKSAGPKWLCNRNYEQILAWEETLKARAIFREALLNNEGKPMVQDQLVLNPTYSLLRDFQKVINEVHILLLLPNKEYQSVFEEKPPMIG